MPGPDVVVDPPTKKPIINLVLCFDGTGNKFSGSDADTNVVKLLRHLNRGAPNQYHYYQRKYIIHKPGIGTYEVNETVANQPTWKRVRSSVSKGLDQGFATTFYEHVVGGYKFLMQHYEDGAKIYMFGFSRGAYTAKFLSQMINKVGLLCKGNEEMVPFAFRLFQSYFEGLAKMSKLELEANHGTIDRDKITKREHAEDDDAHRDCMEDYDDEANDSGKDFGEELDDDEQAPLMANRDGRQHDGGSKAGKPKLKKKYSTETEVKAFRKTFCRKDASGKKMGFKNNNIRVHFLGLWECVSSIALIEAEVEAPLSVFGTAEYVRHAVAIDEQRVKFRPWLLAQNIRDMERRREIERSHSQQSGDDRQQNRKKKDRAIDYQDIREVWFPGSHSDVGGGYPAGNPCELPFEKREKTSLWQTLKQKLGYFLCGSKFTELSDRIQPSDITLAWMMDEVMEVDRKEQGKAPGLSWQKVRVKKFTTDYNEWKSNVSTPSYDEDGEDLGTLHSSLHFNRGASFLTVLLYKILENLPFMPRWELKDNSWEFHRWFPHWYRTRDIPWKAVIHESVFWRLRQDATYRPTNSHGDMEEEPWPCLVPDAKIMEHDGWSRKDHKLWTFQYPDRAGRSSMG